MMKRNVMTTRQGRGRLCTLALLVGAALTPALSAWAAPVSVQDTTETVIGHAPTATPMLSSIAPTAGDTLAVTSGFIDADGDEESGTTYRWQIEKTVGQDDWQDMPGAVTTYKVQPEDSGKKIRVGVIPATDPAITDPSVGVLTYATPATVMMLPNPFDGVLANDYIFALDKGFPSTAYSNASFQFVSGGDASKTGDFVWSSNQPWVTVDSTGRVSFTGSPTTATKKVTIMAVSRDGSTQSMSYTFGVEGYFTSGGASTGTYTEAVAFCSTRGGLVTPKQMIGIEPNGGDVVVYEARGVGSVWGEWGRSFHNLIGWSWTSLAQSSSVHYMASHDGNLWSIKGVYPDSGQGMFICRKAP